jgi:hypothetical protein
LQKANANRFFTKVCKCERDPEKVVPNPGA